MVSLHAPISGGLSLCEGRALASSGSPGTALALASADFDEDGVPDLVSGFSSGSDGTVVVHRGNVAAFWPYGAAIQNGTPAAFLPNPRSFSLPEAPNFVVAGDFDADGHADIVIAHRGSSALYFLKGNGRGGFAAAKRFEVSGAVTDMIAGEMNRPDGLPDIIVGVSGASGSAVLVYQSPMGALKGQPESFALTQPITALALGKFSGLTMRDLAIGAGTELTLVRGRDRKLSTSSDEPVAAAVVTKQIMNFTIRALASGDFTGKGPSVAALGDDGSVHVMEHTLSAEAVTAAFGSAGVAPTMQVAGASDGSSAVTTGSATTNSAQTKATALRSMALHNADAPEWTDSSTVALPNGFSLTVHGLIAAHISGSLQEDLLVVDSANNQVHVLSTLAGQQKSKAAMATAETHSAVLSKMTVLASLAATSTPTAVLPMRLNQHGLSGLVALQSNVSSPIVMPQDVAPTAIFTVTNTSDITDVSQKNSPPAGSLRMAIENSQNAAAANGGTYSIVFNIPTTDPGYNAATGIFKIQPLSENLPNSLDNFALPPINYTVTIDGYTQPGASPNTSVTSDNAKILIQIDGAKATTSGGTGLVPFDDTGTVIRGIAFTGWTNPAISNAGTASGAEGIDANGVGDFIEGNFFGTADGKTASPNRIGIFADNGPAFGSGTGTVIGGTTPQARNIFAANTVYGIALLSTALETQFQGNFVGLDSTGATVLGNLQDGIGFNGATITIGGTAPGARNYIAGNGYNNVDINDLTNGGAATGSYVQGNYIGTDTTGTKGLSATSLGIIIDHNPRNYLIGGTTPAARNLISGNKIGVAVYDNSFYNVVQGDYIGTDATGTVAVPNVLQGFVSGQLTTTIVPAGYTTIGGTTAGAGNLISGNTLDGVLINGTSQTSPGYTPYIGSTVQGNYIGTDVTGTKALPNRGNGVSIALGATNNTISGGNVISFNALNGVLVDPTTTGGPGVGNATVGNIIASNGGAGVRIKSGTANRVSINSIYSNATLGIDIDAAGPSTNTHCNATNTGANLLQNYPVLTAGTGTAYITATATDPSGNTSEFSKAVQATQAANVLSLLGTFDGTPSTKFTIEFFSNAANDPSGYGQGKTYLGSTTITTDATCAGAIADPVDLTQADVSVSLAESSRNFNTGPDFGLYTYTATVSNNGPATAHSVTLTDALPSQLQVSSTYCNVGQCQTPIVASQGICTVSGTTITCNLGTLAPGATASITVPVQALATGSVTNTVNVSATEGDPNLLNNVSSQTVTVTDPYPYIDHINPTAVLANGPDLTLNIYGTGFTSKVTTTFNGTTVKVTGLVDNQLCGTFTPSFCSDLQVLVPASLLTTAGSFPVVISDPAGNQTTVNFTVAAACTYSVFSSLDSDYENSGTNLIAGSVSVSTNLSSCPWTATSSVPWATILDNASATGAGTVDVAIAPNTTGSTRSGSVTVAGQNTTFTQDAGSASVCNVTLDQTNVATPSVGGSGTLNATLSNSSCAPFAEAYPQTSPWIKITSKSNLLIATGPVTYTVSPNNGPARTGAIVVGGNAATFTQAAPSCYFAITPTSMLVPSAGTAGSITVTPSPSTCTWTATSSNTAQVSVTSGASGTGTGTVNYTVAPNTGGPITPTITIGNSTSTSVFTVNQASAYTCTFTVTPTPLSVRSEGISTYATVTASFNFCKWTATSNNPDSLSITGGASGTGSGAVYYTVSQNTGAARTLTLTAGCQTFTVNQDGTTVTNPTPVLTSLQPSSATVNSGALSLTVNGSGFVSGAVANFNGTARVTTFVSATQVTAAILASDVTTAGSYPVTVTNPTPGGGTSNALIFTVNSVATNPVPVLTSLQPSSATAGSAAFTLTVTGTGFVSGSIVNFNGSARITTYVSATQLTAAILAADIATAGSAPVTVTSPTPGGGTSNALTFTINAANNPLPVLASLQPSTAVAGSSAFTLTVAGTSFVSGSVVNFNGSARITTYVSATQLTAAILATDIATAGSASVTVTNPTPGGGTSNALTFTISAANNPAPVITTLQPASAVAGSASFTLTVTGTGFVTGSVVNFKGSARTTTYVSATQLTATVLAADIAATGSAAVTVTSPIPGGGTSNALTFTITTPNNPAPTITALQPSTVTAASGAFTLTINGTNFLSTSTVSLNGNARTTTYVSATQLTAAILASDVTTQGTVSIIVTSPAPGGGTSNAATLTIAAPASFVLSSSTTVQTVAAGGTVQYSITVAAQSGTFANPVQLSVSGLPTGATATFSPATVTPGSSSATSILTIQAPRTKAALELPRSNTSWLAAIFPLFGLLLLRRGRRHRFLLLFFLLVGSGAALVGCGGGVLIPTSAQNYTLTVTGTYGATQQSTSVQLTVNY